MRVNRSFSRQEVYNPNSPLHVDELSLYPDLQTAIGMVHSSGGLAFLAHTFEYSKAIPEALDNIIDYGLDGIECYYSTFTKEQTDYLVNICKQRNLFMSGGSDFHGIVKPKISLGIGQGNLCIPESVVSNWIDKDRIKN